MVLIKRKRLRTYP